MRKPVLPRFLLLLLFYGAVFVFLVQFQFARKTEFTLRTANLVVQGNYGPAGPVRIPNAYPLAGKISVFFGGMEFLLGEGTLYGDRGRIAAGPDMMTLTDNDVYFQFAEGPELTFTTQYTGGAIELVIHGDFSGGGGDGSGGSGVDSESGESAASGSGADSESGESAASGSGGSSPWRSLEIPFRPLETSLVREDSASFLLNADGTGYTFSRQTGPGRKVVLESRNPEISYRALQDEAVNPEQFIIPAALDTGVYGTALSLWLDKSYSFWNSAISRNVPAEHESSGELISAYMNEALKRGVYRAAAAVSSAYQTPSWEGSAYVGRLDGAMRGLSTVEREKSARLARLFNERSAEFLKEFRVIEFLAVRGYTSLMDDAADILRRFDPAAMGAAEAAGILEGRLDWERYRTGHNPYERFVNQALFVITRDLRNDPRTGSALVFVNGEAGTELNLRLGNALVHYENETRAALGRTLLLSVLSLADDSGAAPRVVRQSAGGTFTGSPGRLDSSRIYRICFAGENYARPQPLGGSLWAWTAASSVSASASAAPGRIDIQVQFPPGETHYMMIRGLRPPAGFELNGIVLNQDPQFERYEGSGWAYAAAEQTLLVKLRHRQGLERLSVLY